MVVGDLHSPEEEARKIGGDCLIQGTIYPDIIEFDGGIKAHHNVGGLPAEFKRMSSPCATCTKTRCARWHVPGAPKDQREDALPARAVSQDCGRSLKINRMWCARQHHSEEELVQFLLAGICCHPGRRPASG